MEFKGYFFERILNLFNITPSNIFFNVIHDLDNGNKSADEIYQVVNERYGENGITIDFCEYVTINRESIRIDEIKENGRYATFKVDGTFDIEQFAKDHNLEPIEIER